MKAYTVNKSTLKAQYEDMAKTLFSKKLSELNPYELNAVIANVVKKKVIKKSFDKAMNLYSNQRIAIYFSLEFLMGRIVLDALMNAGIKELTEEIFLEEGININLLEDVDDTALGNGGLGRLAACFIESAATTGYPLYGVGLYYKYGLFKQTFNEYGQQIEVPDDWTKNGEDWFEALNEESVVVEFRDTKVKAIPYVLPVIGYNQNKEKFKGNVFPLMLWKAEAIEGETNDSAAKFPIIFILVTKMMMEKGCVFVKNISL